MERNFVYFRTSNDRPTDDDKSAPRSLLAELGKRAKVSKDMQISWSGFNFDFDLIYQLIAIIDERGNELNHADTTYIIDNSINEIIRTSPGKSIEPKVLRETANKHANAFFSRPRSQFKMIAALSVENLPAKRFKFNNNWLGEVSERLKRFPLPKIVLSSQYRHPFADFAESTQYKWLYVDCSGRTPDEAMDEAMRSLDLFRACLEFSKSAGTKTFRLSTFSQRSRGSFTAGRLFTLHDKDGRPAVHDRFWFNRDFVTEQSLFRDRPSQPLEKRRLGVVRCLANSKYRKELEELLVRYIWAIDQPNDNYAFVMLWSILEKITGSIKHEEVAKSASWIFEKSVRGMINDILLACRQYRNRHVHDAASDPHGDRMLTQIRYVVESHLARLIYNPFGLERFEHYAKLLSLPLDSNELQLRQRLGSIAIRLSNSDKSK